MDPGCADWSGLRAVASAGALLALAWALGAGAAAFGRSRRGARAARRGRLAEQAAGGLLERAGYRVLAERPRRKLLLRDARGPAPVTLEPDFLCRRGARLYVADSKTGPAASPLHPATRRQLLEYALAFGACGALVVDVEGGQVLELELRPLLGRRGLGPGGLLLGALLLGLAWLAGRGLPAGEAPAPRAAPALRVAGD